MTNECIDVFLSDGDAFFLSFLLLKLNFLRKRSADFVVSEKTANFALVLKYCYTF